MTSDLIAQAWQCAQERDSVLDDTRQFCERYLPDFITEYGWYHNADEIIKSHSHVLILVPPGWGKTRGLTVAESIRRIVKDRKHRVGLFSKSQAKSTNYMRAIAGVLKNNKTIIDDFGVFLDNSPDTIANTEKVIVLGAEETETTPTISNLGMSSQVESLRFDTMILDDAVDRETAFSEAEVSRFISQIKLTFLPRLEPGGQFIIIGSRFSAMDGYHWLLNNPLFRGGTFVTAALDENGNTTIPERFDTEYLLRVRDGLKATEEGDMVESSMDWDARYMQNPRAGSEMAFMLDWINETTNPDKWTSETPDGMTIGIDPAYSTAKTADYTGGVCIGMIGKNPVLYDVMEAKISSGFAQTISSFRRRNNAVNTLVETNNAKTLGDELRGMGEPCRDIMARGNKLMRIGNLQHYFKKTKDQGGLLFHTNLKSSPSWQTFLKEYIYFPEAKHEHILDALEMTMTSVMKGGAGVVMVDTRRLFG